MNIKNYNKILIFAVTLIAALILTFALLVYLPSRIQDQVDSLPTSQPTRYTYTVVQTYTHDSNAFTQGLVYAADGVLYEGTGLRGCSSVRKVDLETGHVITETELSREYFGEGITVFDNKVYQLTWKGKKAFVYELDTLTQTEIFSYPEEIEDGWGLTHDGEHLIMSDGTSMLHFLDPKDFKLLHSIEVLSNSVPVKKINELEYIDGQVFANILSEKRIIRIDPQSGNVTGVIDMTGLYTPTNDIYMSCQQNDVSVLDMVLNGIAYDPNVYTLQKPRLLVTGKLWPHLFDIELIKVNDIHQ